MFVRAKRRFKDGKEHRYWRVAENRRNPDGRVVHHQVLYLGEINDSQRAASCRSIEVLCGESQSKPVALFPADREAPELDCEVVQIELRVTDRPNGATDDRLNGATRKWLKYDLGGVHYLLNSVSLESLFGVTTTASFTGCRGS